MPGGFLHVQGLVENFANQGLNTTDLVALSGKQSITETRPRGSGSFDLH